MRRDSYVGTMTEVPGRVSVALVGIAKVTARFQILEPANVQRLTLRYLEIEKDSRIGSFLL